MVGKIIKLVVLAGAAFIAGGYTQKKGGTYDKVEAFGKNVYKKASEKGKEFWNKFAKKAEDVVEEVKEEVEEAAAETETTEEN